VWQISTKIGEIRRSNMKTKPITDPKDIKAGTFYIYVSVAMGGTLSLSVMKLTGRPFAHYWRKPSSVKSSLKIKSTHYWDDSVHKTSDFLSTLGIKDDFPAIMWHRTFPFNETNKRILSGLVEKQDLRAYLDLVGIKISEDTLQEKLAMEKEMLESWDEMEAYGLFDDFGEYDVKEAK
jgi:hypothetical protein